MENFLVIPRPKFWYGNKVSFYDGFEVVTGVISNVELHLNEDFETNDKGYKYQYYVDIEADLEIFENSFGGAIHCVTMSAEEKQLVFAGQEPPRFDEDMVWEF